MTRFGFALLALSVVAGTGCTHVQLRKNTNQQLRTTADLTQQQIMDNVAKIAANESAWPVYSDFGGGNTEVQDHGTGSLGLMWDARTIIQESLGIEVGRQITESWATKPVTDPDRLRAMWAVYHYAVYGTAPESELYSANIQLTKIFGNEWQKLIPTPGWFKTYCEHDYCEKVYCGCIVGHACDCHACVLPGHEHDLQQLTYLIMYISAVTFADGSSFPTGIPESETLAAPSESSKNLKGAPPGFEAMPGRGTSDGKLPTGPAREIFPFPSSFIVPAH